MLRNVRTHLNPASLLAMVALFVALGGISYAAAIVLTPGARSGSPGLSLTLRTICTDSSHSPAGASSARSSRTRPSPAARSRATR